MKPAPAARAERSGRSASSASEREHEPQHAERLVVAAAGDLDEGERAPREHEEPLERLPAAPQERREHRPRGDLARDEERLHGGDRVVDGDDGARREHEERRVDRRVVLVVEAVPHAVAQGDPPRRVGPVVPAVRVAAVGLHAALPDVAVDVVAEQRRHRNEDRPPRERQREGGDQRAPRQSARGDERDEIRGEGHAVEREVPRHCRRRRRAERPAEDDGREQERARRERGKPPRVAQDRAHDLRARADRAAHRAAHLAPPARPRAVVDGHLDDAQAAERRLDLHLDGPAVVAVGHPEPAQRVGADRAERPEVGGPRAGEQVEQAHAHLRAEDRVPRLRPRQPAAAAARADHEVGAAVEDRRDDVARLRGVVAAVAVEEEQHVRVARGRDAGQAGAPVAAARLDHDARAGLARGRRGAVARAVVRHDRLRHERRHRAHDGPDRVLLVERGDHRHDARRGHGSASVARLQSPPRAQPQREADRMKRAVLLAAAAVLAIAPPPPHPHGPRSPRRSTSRRRRRASASRATASRATSGPATSPTARAGSSTPSGGASRRGRGSSSTSVRSRPAWAASSTTARTRTTSGPAAASRCSSATTTAPRTRGSTSPTGG